MEETSQSVRWCWRGCTELSGLPPRTAETRWTRKHTDTHKHFMLHCIHPHVLFMWEAEKVPLLYFKGCRAHSVTQCEENHTPSVQGWLRCLSSQLRCWKVEKMNNQWPPSRCLQEAERWSTAKTELFLSWFVGVQLHLLPFKWSYSLYIVGRWLSYECNVI